LAVSLSSSRIAASIGDPVLTVATMVSEPPFSIGPGRAEKLAQGRYGGRVETVEPAGRRPGGPGPAGDGVQQHDHVVAELDQPPARSSASEASST
jgi:hypothetical protein